MLDVEGAELLLIGAGAGDEEGALRSIGIEYCAACSYEASRSRVHALDMYSR